MKTTINFTVDNIKTLKNLAKNVGKLTKKEKETVLNYVLICLTDYKKVQASLVIDNELSSGHIITELKPSSYTEGVLKHILLSVDFIKGINTPKKASEILTLEFEKQDSFTFNDGSLAKSEKTLTADFPLPPKPKELSTLMALRTDTLTKLKSASISAATSESRPVLTGINIKENKIISTDSHRMFVADTNDRVHYDDVIIPTALIKALETIEPKENFFGALKQATDKSDWVVAETLNGTYYYRQHGGNYPDTSRLIPEDFRTEFELSNTELFKQTLQEALKIVKGDSHHAVTIEYQEGTKFTFLATDGSSKIEQEFVVKTIGNTEELKIHFSCKYMLDAIKQLDSTKGLSFHFTGSMRPFLVNGKNKDITTLILPVRKY
ncbi:hypothetical protein ACPA0F_18380 [Solibacillus silvestris]